MSTEKPAADKEPPKVLAKYSDEQKRTLERIGGSQSEQWNDVVGNQALRSLWIADSDKEARDRQNGAVIAGLIGIGPKDEIEGMIAAQLIATHNAAMECYRRAMMPEQTFEGRRENLSQAIKLSRTCTILVEALNRHRGKGGQQKVTVEHVHVHAGGQAVVGVVEAPTGAGGGDRPKSEDQPHAKQIVHAPRPEVRREDKEREPVPVTGDAERPLPDARRTIAGRSEG